jgi:hypothetical protein
MAPKTIDAEHVLPIRITVVGPPPGVTFAVQSGRHELIPPSHQDADRLSFDLTVRASPTGNSVRFLGPVTQGPPASRFVYVNSGTLAGQPASAWTRRAKVPLTSITPAQVDAVKRSPGTMLEARIAGTSRDGGPACATVPLLDEGWRLVK